MKFSCRNTIAMLEFETRTRLSGQNMNDCLTRTRLFLREPDSVLWTTLSSRNQCGLLKQDSFAGTRLSSWNQIYNLYWWNQKYLLEPYWLVITIKGSLSLKSFPKEQETIIHARNIYALFLSDNKTKDKKIWNNGKAIVQGELEEKGIPLVSG